MHNCLPASTVLTALFAALLLSSCNGASDNNAGTDNTSDNSAEIGANNEVSGSTLPAGQTASYRVRFDAKWSAATHPVNFPDNPHFSPLVGAVHSEQVIFWQRGQIATDGIELMAETGATSELITEIQAAIDDGRALNAIAGGGIGLSPASTTIDSITVTQDYPLVTLVSMIAPSPDWFIGVNSLNMQAADGRFLESVTVALRLYDAGTDSGLQFQSADADTRPRSPVTRLSSDSTDTDFNNGEPTVGTLTFELL